MLSDLRGTVRINDLTYSANNEAESFRTLTLEYAVRVRGNSFSDADSRIYGTFFGPAHEEVAVMIEDRDVNLLAAFGGKR